MTARPDLAPVQSAVERHKRDAGRDCVCNWCVLYRYAAALEQDAAGVRELLVTPTERYGPNKAGVSWVVVDAAAWDRLRALLGSAS